MDEIVLVIIRSIGGKSCAEIVMASVNEDIVPILRAKEGICFTHVCKKGLPEAEEYAKKLNQCYKKYGIYLT